MTPERLLEIEQTAQEFGNANCWTGTSGKLATMILELLKELNSNGIPGLHIEEACCDRANGRGCVCNNDE